MRWMYVVPPATGKVKDSQARTYVAVRMGLRKPLGMLMSANPSTLVNLAPGHSLPIQLYWHCWNLESAVLDALSGALTATAAQTLEAPAPAPAP